MLGRTNKEATNGRKDFLRGYSVQEIDESLGKKIFVRCARSTFAVLEEALINGH
jgi:hypothetical protein